MAVRIVVLAAIAALLSGPAWGQAPDDDEQSYEYLVRQGQLLLDYGKFDEATSTLQEACATPAGAGEFECWRKLGTAAEKAGRIGVAIDAWTAAAQLPGDGILPARREAERLRGAYGVVLVWVPGGRQLPSVPGALEHAGMLIDPALKALLGTVATRVAEVGIDRDELWLPAGSYDFEGVTFDVAPGTETVLELPARVVPWRTAAFRPAEGSSPAPEGGPWSAGVDAQVTFGGAPGGGLGLAPAGVGAQVRFGRRLGPARVEGRFRFGAVPTSSGTGGADDGRGGAAVGLLGQLDAGLDLAPAAAVRLTPHAGLVAGTLGTMLVACRAEAVEDAWVYDGECATGTLVAGGQAGLDVLLLPPSKLGRVGIRIGLFGEALAGGLTAVPGDAFGGARAVVLLKMDRWRFTVVRGGLDVGVSIRF